MLGAAGEATASPDRSTLAAKRILLIVGGGIAAYKACELIRLLHRDGASVRCVLTAGGAQFVTPMTLAALSEQPVHTSLWDLKDEAEMGHIQLSREADLVVVCPATADLLAKMAAGIADDLATTLLLATDKKVLAAPAMNVRMWRHEATKRNVARLREDGVIVLDPDEGEMACGEYGPGRLPEPEAIVAAIGHALRPPDGGLAGRHVIVTAGPTHEPIDPVRVIANRSSGKQGFAVAGALAALGARVTLVAGPVALATPPGVSRVDVETAREMEAAVDRALPADAAVLVAAVADWRVKASESKLKKAEGPPALDWIANPDILAGLVAGSSRPRLLVGFAAETADVVNVAQAKRASKGCDWIVANDVSGDVMGGDANQVHLITADGVESWERASKEEVGRRLAERIAAKLGG
jgi:phosphopantothenoylcysteine decarboxylase / phosphopantothenate---cysteine ligase